jgi:hypothetical protein
MSIDHAALGLTDETPDSDVPALSEETATAAATSEPTESVPDLQAQPSEAEPASGELPKYQFGGREWANQEEAEQSFKSWEGRIQAEQSKVKDYSSRLNEYWDYIQAVSKENQEFRAKAAAPAPEVKKDEGVDFNRIQKLMEIARDQGYDPLAVGIKAYHQMSDELIQKTIDEKLRVVSEPIETMQAERQEAEADRNMFLWAQDLKSKDGTPAYPELQSGSLNEGLTTVVHRVWKELSKTYGPQYGYSAHGFDYAFRLAKDMYHPAPQEEKPRDEQGRFLPSRAAAQASAEVAGSTPNPVKPRRTETQEMLEELAAIKPLKIGETDLGFYE